jgi:hypothetical protein
MKKFLMTIVALVAISMTASAQTVYVSTGDGAVAYHKNKSCSYLANSKDVKSVSTAEAKKMGRHECTRCYGTAAAAKKTTTKAVKKTEGPARDEKGRFIKKADTEKKTTAKKATTTKKADTKKAAEKKTTTTAAKKSTPARDEKGRFVKKADTEKKAEKKSTPARDEKGRFIKKADTEKKTTAKKTKKAA